MQLLAFTCLMAVASSAPQYTLNSFRNIPKPQDVRVLNQGSVQDPSGNYEYGYAQSNGQKVEERGEVRPGLVPETGAITQLGSYEFVADDGNTYQISYVADEYGFQPQGAHLPVAPAQIAEYEQLRRDYPQLFWASN